MKIIGVSGTNGSGKDSLGLVLASDHDWLAISVSDLLRAEAKKRGLPIEREVLRSISAEWRREFGLGVLVDKAVDIFKKSDDKYKGLVVGAMRNPGEAQRVKDLGGVIVWVDADPKIRYERMNHRQRGAEDKKSYEQFLAEEEAEMTHHGGDAATLNMAGVKAMADIFITNSDNDLDKFKEVVEEALASVIN